MNPTRRQLLLSSLFGTGLVGLRALATGLPVGLLLHPREAAADDAKPACVKPQYTFLLTSGGGDPLNANVPGTYDDERVFHSSDPAMARTAMTVGGRSTAAAKPWAQLPPNVLARTCFFHHGTYTNGHGDHAKVNRLMGAVQRQEMLVSLFAKQLQPCLGSVQAGPVVLNNNLITYAGAVMPTLSPSSLSKVLLAPTGPLANLQKLRDAQVDKMNALFKSQGNTAQRKVLDRYALSQAEARSLSQDLLADLGTITGGSREDQNPAAVVLFKMNVSPVVVGSYSFGGDNHFDEGLQSETNAHVASTAALADLFTKLAKYGLTDSVTIAIQNVFGRTLTHQQGGRNHNANHHCSVLIGAGFKSSVIGGLQRSGGDFRATGIDAASGASGTEIPFEETLGAMGKTLARAVGVEAAVLEEQVTKGKIVTAALA